jgi:hypothetical protein
MGDGRVAAVVALVGSGLAAGSACTTFAAEDASQDGGIEAGGADSGAEPGAQTDASACTLAADPTVVATANGAPSRLATDGENVYWIEANGSVMRASLATCATTKIAMGNITGLAVNVDFIAWSAPDVRTVPRSNVVAAPMQSGINAHASLLLAGGSAYWLDSANGNVSECNVPCTLTSIAALVTSPMLLAASPSKLFFFGVHPTNGLPDVNLWWRAISTTATPEIMGPLATQQTAKGLAANSNRVFWVTDGGNLRSVLSTGGATTEMGTIAGVTAIAADETSVYLATADEIFRAPADGMGPVSFVKGQKGPVSLVVTNDALVWANRDDLTIRRVRK